MLTRIRRYYAARRLAAQLIAFHRQTFGSLRMEDTGEGGDGEQGAQAGGGQTNEPDFPPNTPVAEMTDKQAAAYWKTMSRKHEGTVKSRADYEALKAKAEQYDKLDNASKTEHERALEEAKKSARGEAKAEADKALLPKLVKAEFKAAAAGRLVDAEGNLDTKRLNALLDPLDMSKFITEEGEVDSEKVSHFIATAVPQQAKGGNGFPDLGQGRRQDAQRQPGDQGRAMAEKRFGKRS